MELEEVHKLLKEPLPVFFITYKGLSGTQVEIIKKNLRDTNVTHIQNSTIFSLSERSYTAKYGSKAYEEGYEIMQRKLKIIEFEFQQLRELYPENFI